MHRVNFTLVVIPEKRGWHDPIFYSYRMVCACKYIGKQNKGGTMPLLLAAQQRSGRATEVPPVRQKNLFKNNPSQNVATFSVLSKNPEVDGQCASVFRCSVQKASCSP